MTPHPLSEAPAARRGLTRRARRRPDSPLRPGYWTRRRDALRRELIAAVNDGCPLPHLFDKFNAYIACRELAAKES